MADFPSTLYSGLTVTDGVEDVLAAHMNNRDAEVVAIETELGTDPAGTATDLKTRLAQVLLEAATMNTETLTGNKTLTDTDGAIQNLDPGGSSRDVSLPAEATSNAAFIIVNAADAAEDLVVKSDAPVTIVTLKRGQSALLFSDGTTWRAIVMNGTRGKQTVFIPASFMYPQTSSGCAEIAQTELTASQPELKFLAFDGTTAEFAQFSLGFPKKWDKGTVAYRARWAKTGADTDGVAWTLQGVAQADDDPINVAFGSIVTVIDYGSGIARDMLISDESTAVTIAGSPGDDEHVYFRFGRDPTNGSDVATEDAELIGIDLFYKLEAESDD